MAEINRKKFKIFSLNANRELAQEIADLKEMSYEQLTKQTFNNACTLFGLEDKKEID